MQPKHVISVIVVIVLTKIFQDELTKQLRRLGFS